MGVGAVVQARGAEAVSRTEMGTHLGQDLGPPSRFCLSPQPCPSPLVSLLPPLEQVIHVLRDQAQESGFPTFGLSLAPSTVQASVSL